MAEHVVPHYQNDKGDRAIDIGVTEFMCVGTSPPLDHPHVFLDMGDDGELVCPYCGTLYRFRRDLGATQTDPPGHLYQPQAS